MIFQNHESVLSFGLHWAGFGRAGVALAGLARGRKKLGERDVPKIGPEPGSGEGVGYKSFYLKEASAYHESALTIAQALGNRRG